MMRDSMLINDKIADLEAEIKRLKDKYEPDYEAGWYWVTCEGWRGVVEVEEGESYVAVGVYGCSYVVDLSECTNISLITDPLDVLQEWNDNIDRLATPPR